MTVHDLGQRRNRPPGPPPPDTRARIARLVAHTKQQLTDQPCGPDCEHCPKDPTP